MLTIEEINKRIEKEFSEDVFNQLSDKNLLEEYKKTKSTKEQINKITLLLKKYDMINEHFNDFINEYIEQNIKPGTKAVIRGNKFNTIIKKYLNEINKDLNLNIQFEKQSNKFNYDEIPDWIIEKDNKILIGMNQIDLWNGGEQINRGLKYLKFTYDKEKYKDFDIKLICVVCNKLKLISNKNKKYTLFNIGFNNNTLCYINNLKKIIYEFFDIKNENKIENNLINKMNNLSIKET